MTARRYYTTAEVMAILDLRSRQTLYNWDAKPDRQAPGTKGILMWSRKNIVALAADHNRPINWNAVT